MLCVVFVYTLIGSELSVVNQERDLGVIVDSSVKMSARCAEL